MLAIDELKTMQKNAVLLHSKSEVEEAIDRVAQQVTEKMGDEHPVLLCAMTGALTFMGQLITKLNFLLQTDYIHTSRFRGEMTGGNLEWISKPTIELKDRTILVVEDILDSGITLAAIKDYCYKQEAKEVYSAVLVDKDHPREEGGVKEADFTGLYVEDKFLIGYGLDYRGFFRNLAGIYAVES